MENKSIEIDRQLKRIEELTTNFSISKYNFLKISFLIRLIEDSQKFAPECPDCHANCNTLQSLIEEIPLLDDIHHRQPYEQQFNAIRKHFHNKHGYIPLYHFVSRFSLMGIGLGVLFSYLAALIFKVNFFYNGLLMGLAMGLMVGYIWGYIKELGFRQSKKII